MDLSGLGPCYHVACDSGGETGLRFCISNKVLVMPMLSPHTTLRWQECLEMWRAASKETCLLVHLTTMVTDIEKQFISEISIPTFSMCFFQWGDDSSSAQHYHWDYNTRLRPKVSFTFMWNTPIIFSSSLKDKKCTAEWKFSTELKWVVLLF
jgi:hypothetical protein